MKRRPHKYNARITKVNGITFPSALEAEVYWMLTLREKAGEISNLRTQHCVTLKARCEACGEGPKKWKVDFSFTDNKTGETVFAEAKGIESPKYKRDKKLWKADPPGKLEIWKAGRMGPMIVEEIE